MNMEALAATAAWLPALNWAASAEEAPAVKVTRIGAQASTQDAADYFAGAVLIDSPFKGSAPAGERRHRHLQAASSSRTWLKLEIC